MDFDEELYLTVIPDIECAVRAGSLVCECDHWEKFGSPKEINDLRLTIRQYYYLCLG
jgi:hypothetical protein